MSRPISSAVILAAALATPAFAVDRLSYLDLRLGGGILSNEYRGGSSTTINNGDNSISSTTTTADDARDADSNVRGQLQLVGGRLGRFGGLIAGVGIAVNNAEFDNDGYDATITTPVVDIMLGYGIAVNNNLHFELLPFAGLGRSYYSVKNDNGDTETSKEWEDYVEYGASLGAYYTTDGGFQVGVQVPYLAGRFDADYSHDSGTDTYTVSDERRNRGFGVLASIGGRF